MQVCLIFVFIICWISFIVAFTHRTLLNPLKYTSSFSQCDHCLHTLNWWQLIPVGGWVFQKGRCHWCQQPIDAFNPMIELILTAWYLSKFQIYGAIPTLIILTTITIITTTDWYEQWINPVFLCGFLPFRSVMLADRHWFIYLIEVSLILFLLRMNYQQKLGFGDTAYLIIILFSVGLTATCWIILCACLLIILTSRYQTKSLPFIPYLNLGLILIV